MKAALLLSLTCITLGCITFGWTFLAMWVCASLVLGLLFALFVDVDARRWK